MAIFVSYSSIDQKQVKVLLGQLAKLKQEVYTEAKSIAGEVAWSVIFETIQQCEAFILTLTPNTLLSEARRLEYQYAAALHKPIVVVALEAVPENAPDDGKLAYIDVSKVVDFRELDENTAYALSEALDHLPSVEPAPDPLPPVPDWMPLLSDIKQTVQQPRIPFKEQPKLVLNLREFTERKETHKTAVELLKTFNKHSGRSVDSGEEIALILNELEQVDRKSRGGAGGRVAIALIGVFALLTLGIVVIRGFPALNSQATAAVTSTSTPTAMSSATLAGESIVTPRANATSDTNAAPSTQPTTVPAITSSPVPPTVTITASPTSTSARAALQVQAPSDTPTATPSVTASQTASSVPTVMPTNTKVAAALAVTATSTASATLPVPTTRYTGIRVEDSEQGVIVVEVGSTAQLAGVKVGDYVVTVDLQPVDSRETFMQIMNQARPFSTVSLHVRSSDGLTTIQLLLGGNDFTIISTPTTPPTATSPARSTP